MVTVLAVGIPELTPVLLIGATVLIVAVGAVRFAVRSGLPTLLIYLAFGLLLGSDWVGLEFSDARMTQMLGYLALILILAEGGLTTEWKDLRRAILPAGALATVGVLVSMLVMGLFMHLALDVPWKLALLFGAVLSSTDAAAVFSVLRGVGLPRRLSGILEAESGLNDPPVVIMVTILAVDAIPGNAPSPWWEVVVKVAYELGAAALLGVGIGWLGAAFMRRAASGSSGLLSLGIIAVTVLAYAVAASLHASGFMATYVSAIVLANRPMPHGPAVRSFAQAVGWSAQIGLFVMLGLLANVEDLPGAVLLALLLGAVLTFVARPVSVLVSLTPFRVPWREQVFVSWAGLRGAVPVVLATVPATMGTPGTENLFETVFVLVVVLTLLQAPTMPWLARRLGVAGHEQIVDLEVESTPLVEMGAVLLHLHIGDASLLHGIRVRETRLPQGATITLIVRGEKTFAPDSDTVFRHGDDVLIVARSADQEQVEATMRALSERGRLPFWHRPGATRTTQPRGAGRRPGGPPVAGAAPGA